MSDYLERIGQDKIEDREEIEQLTSRVRELAEENTVLVKTIQRDTLTSLRQLAASQLHAEQLLEAIDRVRSGAAALGLDRIFDIATEALALPRDTSALDAYVAEKVKELQERLSKALAVLGADTQIEAEVVMLNYKNQIATITKQRNLAVDALEWAADVLPPSDPGGIGGCDCPVCRALEAIKESEAMAQGEKP